MAVIQPSSQRSSTSSSCVEVRHNLVLRVLMAMVIITLSINAVLIIPLERHVVDPSAPISKGNAPPPQQQQQLSPFSIFFPKLTEAQGRERILAIFKEANVTLNQEMMDQLPTWNQVQSVVGEHPFVDGLEMCAEFRAKVPAVERMLGAAGMFNTGTNLGTFTQVGTSIHPLVCWHEAGKSDQTRLVLVVVQEWLSFLPWIHHLHHDRLN
jgi:hypothetical protein